MARRRSRRRRLLIVAAVVLAILIVVGRACVIGPASGHPGASFDRGTSASWSGIVWSNEEREPTEIVGLAQNLRRQQIRDAYVYVSFHESKW